MQVSLTEGLCLWFGAASLVLRAAEANAKAHHVQLNNFVVHVVHATACHLRNSSSFRVIEETAS